MRKEQKYQIDLFNRLFNKKNNDSILDIFLKFIKFPDNPDNDKKNYIFKQFVVNLFYSILYKKIYYALKCKNKNMILYLSEKLKFFRLLSNNFLSNVKFNIKVNQLDNIHEFLMIIQDHPYGIFPSANLAYFTTELIKNI